MKTLSRSRCLKQNLDRFIPNRTGTKFDFAVDKGWRSTFDDSISPRKATYLRRLRQVFNIEDQRILAFHNKPRPPVRLFDEDDNDFFDLPKPLPRRQIPKSPDGCTVASAGGESLLFWKVFGAQKVAVEPFSDFSHACGRNM